MPAGGRERVALILAAGLSLALILLTAGVLWDAIFSQPPGLDDHATQIMSLAFGGIIGVVGSYMGYKAGSEHNNQGAAMTTTEPEPGDGPQPEPTPEEEDASRNPPDAEPAGPPEPEEGGEDHDA